MQNIYQELLVIQSHFDGDVLFYLMIKFIKIGYGVAVSHQVKTYWEKICQIVKVPYFVQNEKPEKLFYFHKCH